MFMKSDKGCTERTIKSYSEDLKAFQNFFINRDLVYDIKKNDVRAYKFHLVDRGLAPRTVNRSISAIRSFYSYYVDHDNWNLGKNPAKNIPRMKVPKTIPITIAEEDAETLLDFIYLKGKYAIRDYAIFSTFIFTALRVSEVINLDLTDLDFRAGKILVRQGKGQKDRFVPMIPRLAKILKLYINTGLCYNEYGKINKARSGRKFFYIDPKNQALFLTSRGQRFTEKGVEYHFKKYTNLIGIYRKGLSLHAMRRSCLTFLYRAGVDLFVLKEISGHARLQTLENYIVVDEEKVMGAALKHPLADREIDQRLVDLFLMSGK